MNSQTILYNIQTWGSNIDNRKPIVLKFNSSISWSPDIAQDSIYHLDFQRMAVAQKLSTFLRSDNFVAQYLSHLILHRNVSVFKTNVCTSFSQ